MNTAASVYSKLSTALAAFLGKYDTPGGLTPAIRILPVPENFTPPLTGLEVLIRRPKLTPEPLQNREYHELGTIHVRIVAHGSVRLDTPMQRVNALYPLATVRYIPETEEYPAQATIQIPTQ